MHNVVFDTVIFVRSLINPKSYWGRLVFDYFSNYRLFVSQQILIEILEVLKRPEITRKYRFIESLDIKSVLNILKNAEIVDLSEVPAVSRDIKDDKFLATAKLANANYLISADRDLLDLKEYEGIKIIDAQSFSLVHG